MALVLLCQHQQMPLLWECAMNNDTASKMAHEIQYRRDQKTIADLTYENQVLRTKIVTWVLIEIATIVILVTAIFVNASK